MTGDGRERRPGAAGRRHRHRHGRPRHGRGARSGQPRHHGRRLLLIVAGIRRGRGIFDNLHKAMSYIIRSTCDRRMSLIPVFVAHWPLVLLPVQIAFLELIIDPPARSCSRPRRSTRRSCTTRRAARAADVRPPRHGDPFARAPRCWPRCSGLPLALLAGRGDEIVRSLTFATLVIGNLALILVIAPGGSRSGARSGNGPTTRSAGSWDRRHAARRAAHGSGHPRAFHFGPWPGPTG